MPFRNGISKGGDYSNDPEFRFLKKLWCLLYKSPSEIQDISLKWSTYFFSPMSFPVKRVKTGDLNPKNDRDHDRIFSYKTIFVSGDRSRSLGF